MNNNNADIPDEFICAISQNVMRDPVTLNCGHTFDRESLQNWLIVNELCPNCRRRVDSSRALITNYTLKSLIERGNRPFSSASLREEVFEENEIDESIDTKCLNETWATYFRRGDGINLQIHTPGMAKRRPVAFVCVIDVSGSMGSAVGAGEAGSGMAYSRLDLVKHVLNVLIACLKDQDKLALISFSDQAELVMGLTPMTKMNKNLAKTAVQVLTPQMNTYMGPAIKKAYDVFGEASLSANYLKSIILLTDGQDTMGVEYVNKAFNSIVRPPRIQLSTFGFGNDLTSMLLQDLAVKGGGIFGFIPDQSMIGTIFVNFVANTFLTMAQDVIIDVGPNYELNEHDSPKTCLQYGRERHYLLRRKDARSSDFVLRLGFDEKSMVPIKIKEDSPGSEKSFEIYQTQLAKYKMLDLVMDKNLPKVRINDFVNCNEIKNVPNFWHELKQEDHENDQNNEQIRLSLEYWKTWGSHYLKSFVFAHLLEQCLNFKSPSMKTYQSDRFNDLVFKLTDLFVTLPPPPPSTQANTNMPTVTMHSIMDYNNGCILASCLVRTIDGRTKMIGSLRKGDILENGAVVKCVILSHYEGVLIRIGNSLLITPYHPVKINNKWTFPIDAKEELIELDRVMVCNLVLDRGHVVSVGGIDCVTLGHGLEDDEVVKHPYYGTNRVIDDLMQLDGWNEGLIVLKEFRVSRDEKGFVNGSFNHRYVETY